jgi:hypothetical protein
LKVGGRTKTSSWNGDIKSQKRTVFGLKSPFWGSRWHSKLSK